MTKVIKTDIHLHIFTNRIEKTNSRRLSYLLDNTTNTIFLIFFMFCVI